MRALRDPDELVSDAERAQAVVALREHLLAGRLTLEDFSERVEVAYQARVGHELALASDGLRRRQASRFSPAGQSRPGSQPHSSVTWSSAEGSDCAAGPWLSARSPTWTSTSVTRSSTAQTSSSPCSPLLATWTLRAGRHRGRGR
ncbi:MAG: DUF1707 SHOCT-like domain-containing protein [Solirubrobacteraceae bacterium]